MTNKRNDTSATTTSSARSKARESRRRKVEDEKKKFHKKHRSRSRNKKPDRSSKSKTINESPPKHIRNVAPQNKTRSNISAASNNNGKINQNEPAKGRRQPIDIKDLKKETIRNSVPNNSLKNKQNNDIIKVEKQNLEKSKTEKSKGKIPQNEKPGIAKPIPKKDTTQPNNENNSNDTTHIYTRPKWIRMPYKKQSNEKQAVVVLPTTIRPKRYLFGYKKPIEEQNKSALSPTSTSSRISKTLFKLFRQDDSGNSKEEDGKKINSKLKSTLKLYPTSIIGKKKIKSNKGSRASDSAEGNTNLLDQLVSNFNVEDNGSMAKKIFRRQVWALSKQAIKLNRSWKQPFIDNGINIDDININRINLSGIDVDKLGQKHKRLKRSLIWLLK